MGRLRDRLDETVPPGVRILASWLFPQREGRGPKGRRFCRMCQIEVPPRRLTFCSDRCVTVFESYVRPLPFVMQADQGQCRGCGQAHSPSSPLEMDHIVPLIEGGKTILRNLRMLCWECHGGETKSLRGRLALQRKIEAARASGQIEIQEVKG